MSDKKQNKVPRAEEASPTRTCDEEASAVSTNGRAQDEQTRLTESRKIGIPGAVFLILNKMIGTGSKWPEQQPRMYVP